MDESIAHANYVGTMFNLFKNFWIINLEYVAVLPQ